MKTYQRELNEIKEQLPGPTCEHPTFFFIQTDAERAEVDRMMAACPRCNQPRVWGKHTVITVDGRGREPASLPQRPEPEIETPAVNEVINLFDIDQLFGDLDDDDESEDY